MKKKILYAEDNEDVREIFSLKIQQITDLEIEQVASGQEAVARLKNDATQFCLVISDMQMINGTGKDIYDFMMISKTLLPFILMSGEGNSVIKKFSNFYESNKYNKVMDKPPAKGQLEESLEFLKFIDLDRANLLEKEFIPIRINLLYRGKFAPSDIFLQLSPNKYVHLYNKGDNLSNSDILKYENKNVEVIYVKNDQFGVFVDSYVEIISDVIRHEKKGVLPSSLQVHFEVHELIHQQLLSIGLSPASVELSKKTVYSTISSIESEPNLLNIILKVANNADWLYEHSLLLAFLSSMILSKLEWSSKDTLYKVTIAAFFHDIVLKNDEEAKKLELSLMNKTGEEIKNLDPKFFEHPLDSSQYIHDFRLIPPDSNTIIALSHEKPDGTGFPNGLTAYQTFPLACVMNTAHAFLNELYLHGFTKQSIVKALIKMEPTYSQGHYQNPFEQLKKIFK